MSGFLCEFPDLGHGVCAYDVTELPVGSKLIRIEELIGGWLIGETRVTILVPLRCQAEVLDHGRLDVDKITRLFTTCVADGSVYPAFLGG